jgi:hypothetical protein
MYPLSKEEIRLSRNKVSMADFVLSADRQIPEKK